MIFLNSESKQKIIDLLNSNDLFPEGTTIELCSDGQYREIEAYLRYYLDASEIEDVISEANLPYTLNEIMGNDH